MTTYLELPLDLVPEADWTLGLRALKYAAHDLGLAEEPALRWFVEGSPSVKASWSWTSFERDTPRRAELRGTSEHVPGAIWVRDGQTPAELLTTVFHELRHIKDGPMFGGALAERYEADAEAYGRKMAAEFEARPKGIKAAWEMVVPTVTLRYASTVFATPTDPGGVDDATDLGDGLWSSRPLVIDGWGLSALKLGEVTDVGMADDERLFFEAQLARHARYRDQIARLVEQGSVKATPMVLDRAVRQDRWGRYSALPVGGVLLSPVAA